MRIAVILALVMLGGCRPEDVVLSMLGASLVLDISTPAEPVTEEQREITRRYVECMNRPRRGVSDGGPSSTECGKIARGEN